MQLAHGGCAYVRAESGARGMRSAHDVVQHLDWVHTLLSITKNCETSVTQTVIKTRIFQHVITMCASAEGIWRPAEVPDEITKGMVLGQCCAMDGLRSQVVKASVGGVRLWWKETMSVRRGDVLYAIGR
jgi:hypothetical protein